MKDISDYEKDYCWALGELAWREGEKESYNPFRKDTMNYWVWLRAWESRPKKENKCSCGHNNC
jgi:hypothetical protein